MLIQKIHAIGFTTALNVNFRLFYKQSIRKHQNKALVHTFIIFYFFYFLVLVLQMVIMTGNMFSALCHNKPRPLWVWNKCPLRHLNNVLVVMNITLNFYKKQKKEKYRKLQNTPKFFELSLEFSRQCPNSKTSGTAREIWIKPTSSRFHQKLIKFSNKTFKICR